MGIFLKIYLIGVGICLLANVLSDHFYCYAGHSELISARDYLESILSSLGSWLTICIILIPFYILEARNNHPMYGFGKSLADEEKELQNKSQSEKDTKKGEN